MPGSSGRHPRRLAGAAAILLSLAVLASAGLVVGLGVAITRQMPDVTRVFAPPSQASRIYAADGELIASLYRENREPISLSAVPQHVRQAVLAIEDARFYQHRGIDLVGIGRAVWHDIQAREIIEGGSTITQQLARLLFLSQERVLSRKLAEIVLALEIERRLTKDEILERYLNEVYFGEGAYGIEMAARLYFGKPAAALTLAEGALLAGIIRAPSADSPHKNLKGARNRQALVLERMAARGMITPRRVQQARMQAIRLQPPANAGLVSIRAPYFVSYILPALRDLFGEELMYRGGLEIVTTLDTRMQQRAQQAVRKGLDRARSRRLNVSQGALAVVDPRSGHIKALVGGYDFAQSQFNRAWQARRQPGSAFKPFVYTAALANGVRTTRVLIDARVTYRIAGSKPWSPKNYDRRYRGPITVRRAIEQSVNIPAVRMLSEIGPDRAIEYARRMGITSRLQPNLSLALGTNEVTPLEMAAAYGVLGNLGLRVQPTAVLKVTDASGKVVYEAHSERELALTPEVAYVMTDVLKGVIRRGTGRAANIDRPAAGKTGTTDDYRNAWFIGYTPHLSAAVWVGNDDNEPMRRVVGGGVPAEIWAAFMKAALAATPRDDWTRPEAVVRRGGDLFIRGTEPPAEEPKPELNENGATVNAASGPALAIASPSHGARVRTPVMIRGTATPGATVGITVEADGGILAVRLVETYVPADAQGRFAYEFRPAVPVPGIRYTITVSAAVSGLGATTRTITISEATP